MASGIELPTNLSVSCSYKYLSFVFQLPESQLTFEGQEFRGREAIVKKLVVSKLCLVFTISVSLDALPTQ